ncbi:T9SS type A sorting domain-containing protein [Kriegella aquimaris]|uniref:Por secretion system C-terminal sorting domain-containing protein n=1 Tax=Kriegella aquimaris TaxID=192904 RepID=A0A1G9VIQ0_9FLAO|nr:T9SS type A sorting domain-containing protein [Kriegella aquimaris]SDM71911.1 Por secretion system C-terminal sorting domain-containing protein [Kriegella aquimaris]
MNSGELSSFKVSGSKEYTVAFNGNIETFLFDSTSEREIKLYDLKTDNKILISGKSDCQGKLEDTVLLTDKAMLYPTFSSNNIYMVNEEPGTEVFVYNQSGKLLLHKKTESLKSKSIDLTGYASGLYIVHLRSKGTTETFKVIKK